MKVRDIETVIDADTGEVISRQVSTKGASSFKLPKEPAFFKAYYSKDMYDRFSNSQLRLAARLAQFAGYDGIVFVNDKVKAFIKDELGYNANVLRVNLHGLIKVGLLSKSGCGQTQYRINPFLFGKGKWEDIYEQQQAFSPGDQTGETG